MRSLAAVILFFSFIFGGYKFATLSWGGTVYVYLGEERSPAAVRNTSDYSEVSYRNLGAAPEVQLIAEAEVEMREGSAGIYLGNPLFRTTRGNEFGCRVKEREGLYDRVELHFIGSGISTSGDTAEMIVEAPCESVDLAWALQPVWIPIQQIVSGPAKDMDLAVDGEHPVNVRLRHMPDEWPPQWVLTKVKLYRADDGEYFFEADSEKMRFARHSLLFFETP